MWFPPIYLTDRLKSLLTRVPSFFPAPLVDLTPTHSGSAMLMLLSVVFVGLAVFVIYKFKRCVFLPLPPTSPPPPLSSFPQVRKH